MTARVVPASSEVGTITSSLSQPGTSRPCVTTYLGAGPSTVVTFESLEDFDAVIAALVAGRAMLGEALARWEPPPPALPARRPGEALAGIEAGGDPYAPPEGEPILDAAGPGQPDATEIIPHVRRDPAVAPACQFGNHAECEETRRPGEPCDCCDAAHGDLAVTP